MNNFRSDMKPFTIGKNEANKSHEDQTSQNEMNILLRCISTLDPITIDEASRPCAGYYCINRNKADFNAIKTLLLLFSAASRQALL